MAKILSVLLALVCCASPLFCDEAADRKREIEKLKNEAAQKERELKKYRVVYDGMEYNIYAFDSGASDRRYVDLKGSVSR